MTADFPACARRDVTRLAGALALLAGTLALGGAGVLVQAAGALPAAAAQTNNGDNARDGWYPDEPGLSPSSIADGDFGQLFSTQLTGAVYGQPLLDEGVLVVGTEADWLYGLDPVSGEILWQRQVGTSFQEGAQEGCGDLQLSGITATGVVDPSTGILYFTDKQYVSGDSGPAQYWLHAVDPLTGDEEPNFPVLYEGQADNDPTQIFSAYYQDQRPGLLLLGGVVYAAFGSTCDLGTYSGWVFGVSTAGAITARWNDEAGQGPTAQAGIWMAGSGIMSDGPGTMVVVTSNGVAPPGPGPGDEPPQALGQSVVRLYVEPNGQLQPVDYFSPSNAAQLSALDQDFGSGGAVQMPPVTFSTPAHPELIATIGKEGYLYLLDAASLGGMGQGPDGGNADVARAGPIGGVWGKTAWWPGDGGYGYTVTASQGGGPGKLRALAWGTDAGGTPQLSIAGSSSDGFGYGSSAPAVTSNGTASGSATLWTVWASSEAPEGSPGGSEAQLRAYDPVPVNGVLQEVWSAPIGQASKFLVPTFDDGRVYVGNINGVLFGFGEPVPHPLSASPTSFPAVPVGSSLTEQVELTASGPTTISALSSDNGVFSLGTPSLPLPATLTAGQSLGVPVTFSPAAALPAAATLTVGMTGGAFPTQRFGLAGAGEYATGHPVLSPAEIDFGNVAVGTGAQTEAVQLQNVGAEPLTITSVTLPHAPFSVTSPPAGGTVVAPGSNLTLPIDFAPVGIGNFVDALTVGTNDGSAVLELTGGAGYPPAVEVAPASIDFGTVPVGASATRTFALTNAGGSPATITLSKPPVLDEGFSALSSLPEATTLPPGATLTETVAFTPTQPGALADGWVIDADDGLAKRVVAVTGTGGPPLAPTISVDSLNLHWPASGTATANFVVSLSAPSTQAVSVQASTQDQTASAAGGDYVALADNTVTFPPGTTSETVPVTVEPNGPAHPDPVSFALVLSAPTGAMIGNATGEANLVWGSAAVDEFLYAAPAAVVQSLVSSQTVDVPVSLRGGSYAATCAVSTADGTATAASGAYTPISGGIVTIGPSQTGTVIPVTIPPASAPQPTETFSVELSGCNFGVTPAAPVATVTIVGLAGAPGELQVSQQAIEFGTVADGVSETRTFTLVDTGGSPATVTASTPPSAGTGFVATTSLPVGTVIAPGQRLEETVVFDPASTGPLSDSWVIAADDGLGARTVNIAGTGIGPPWPDLTVSWLNLVRPTSGTATAAFILSLSAPGPGPNGASVTVRTVDGTATASAGDYVPIAHERVSFAPGQTTATVAVTVNGKVANHEYFGLQVIGSQSGVSVPDDYGRANLLRPSDAVHELVYAGSTFAVQTSAAPQTALVPVTVSPATHSDTVTCTASTADGTATAAAGDYVPLSGVTVTVGPGQANAEVPISLPASTNLEANLSFDLTLSACSANTAIAVPSAEIVLDPTPPAVTSGPDLVLSAATLAFGTVPLGASETLSFSLTNEGGSPATITASAPPSAGVGFSGSAAGLTAGSVLAPGASEVESVTFAPAATGPTSDGWVITAGTLGSFDVGLTGGGVAALPPDLTVSWLNVVRPPSGTATADFALTLSSPSPGPNGTSVTVRTIDGTATAAAGDYVPIAGQRVTFAPGQTSATVVVTVNGKVATHEYFGLQVVAESGVSVPDDYGRANLLRPTDAAHEFVYAGSVVVVQSPLAPQSVLVPVTVSPAGHPDTVTCSAATSDGSATAAEGDYRPESGVTVTIPPGSAAGEVAVVIPAGSAQLPNRLFHVNLSNCSANAATAVTTADITVVDSGPIG